MPEYHSIGGNLHGGKKATCAKCGYVAPAPKPEPAATSKSESKKPKKSKAKKVVA